MALLYYRLTRRGTEVTSEVICQRHYAATPAMHALSAREMQAGYKQSVEPYTRGDRGCATCEQDAEGATL